MCDCDLNPPRVYRCEVRKARKPYKCHECRRDIGKGELHDVHSGFWDWGFDTFRWCAHCTAAQAAYEAITGEHCYCFGDLWGPIVESTWWNARTWDTRVARLVVGMRRKWAVRRGARAGTLMPVPRVPAVAEGVAP